MHGKNYRYFTRVISEWFCKYSKTPPTVEINNIGRVLILEQFDSISHRESFTSETQYLDDTQDVVLFQPRIPFLLIIHHRYLAVFCFLHQRILKQ